MKALVIAVYIGPLPALMPLWLRSAASNPQLDFLVVNDREAPPGLPVNVRFARADLASLRDHWSGLAGIQVALETPYKLNDFKPLCWSLASDLERYDYWGFCDLDVIFGQLGVVISDRLGRYDMICSEGHFRLLRNDERTRNAWREVAHPRSWQDILTDPANFGMDEHHGLNGVFAKTDRSWFTQPDLIADIDPSFRQMRRMARYRNARHQAWYWENGRIFREYLAGGSIARDEYAYIHLQKRKQAVDPACNVAPAFNIDPTGIVPRQPGDGSEDAIRQRNPWQLPDRQEARIQLREWVRELRGIEHVIRPVDRIMPGARS